MKLDEAIKHLDESLADPGHDWGCEECKGEHAQLLKWLRELKELREENKVLISECDGLIKEKGELLKKSEQIVEYKRLLKAAVEGFEFLGAWMDEYGECTLDCSNCPLHKPSYYCKGWNRQDEALALIGEEGGNDA